MAGLRYLPLGISCAIHTSLSDGICCYCFVILCTSVFLCKCRPKSVLFPGLKINECQLNWYNLLLVIIHSLDLGLMDVD